MKNCSPQQLVTDILQNIFLCVQEKIEIHTGLEQLKAKYMDELSF